MYAETTATLHTKRQMVLILILSDKQYFQFCSRPYHITLTPLDNSTFRYVDSIQRLGQQHGKSKKYTTSCLVMYKYHHLIHLEVLLPLPLAQSSTFGLQKRRS